MRIASLAVATMVAALASPAFACDDHTPGKEPAKQSVSRPSGWIEGEVREVDLDDGTVALSHGRIAAWRMMPMSSMIFKATDTSRISKLNAGDKVKFRAAMVGQRPTVTEIKLATK
jgi:Cu(I)/Ag(I) efflux system periplasmic protein CusF